MSTANGVNTANGATGVQRTHAGEDSVERFALSERVVHWMVAICFLYSAASGLALFSHRSFWLATVLGGGEAVRWGHPWGGLAFAAALGVMFLRWARHMRLDRDDRTWLRRTHRYVTHRHDGLPESGRFNAGQKLLFWTQSTATLLLFGSGIVLWFPEAMPRTLTYAGLLAHPLAAILALGGIIVHIYMATAVVPGSLQAMTRGRVSGRWAAAHHSKWLRQISRR